MAVGIFGVAWVAMVVAMMVPSGYALVRGLAATIAGRPDRTGSVAAFLTADVLLLAGAFQLTGRKLRCLERCRHPAWLPLGNHPHGAVAGGVTATGPGARARAAAVAGGAAGGGAFPLGRSHGLACLGSCWALMLVVFALESPQVAWMALFGGLMVDEKVGRHGVAVARLAGAALLAASVVVALW